MCARIEQVKANLNIKQAELTRRDFVKTTAATVAGTSIATSALGLSPRRRTKDTLTIGVIGCGGRGTGAAANALEASQHTRIVALADVFADRLNESRGHLKSMGDRAMISDDNCFVGFDAYQQLLDHVDVDVVILATPPHFRPMHFDAAIKAGKHVFMEKPVAVDARGIRSVIESGMQAKRKKLSVVAGTQRRHEASYLTALKKIREGAIGDIIAARCYWNQGGLWMNDRQPSWSDMEWQLRNWLYFTWLSGDHIVEQHVHNLDVCNWALGSHPVRALGVGGRQARTQPEYGHVFDHFAIEFEYPHGQFVLSMCRQQDGCPGRVEEVIHGTKGRMMLSPGSARIVGETEWRFDGENANPYVQEHRSLIASITGQTYCNEAQQVAESTLTAIMGRMAAYTGQTIEWDAAMNSEENLSPSAYEFGPLDVPPVAVPGKTKFR